MSKLMGDMAIEAIPNHLVIRTSGVYGTKKNFPLVVYQRLRDGKDIKVIDSYYSPIHAKNLAKASSDVIKSNLTGRINISGERISRKNFAIQIAEFFKLDPSKILESSEFSGQVARRPKDSSLKIDEARSIIKWDFYSVKSNLSLLDVKNLHL
jgi:dTDP-4-dehydrorhamnose reductase